MRAKAATVGNLIQKEGGTSSRRPDFQKMVDHVLEKVYAQQELASLQIPSGLDTLVKEAVIKPVVSPREDAV